MCMGGGICCSKSNLLGVTYLKKTDSSFPNSYQLPIFPQLGAGLHDPLHHVICARSWLAWSCAGNDSCCELMCATACQVHKTLLPLALTIFSPPLPWWFLILGKSKCDTEVPLIYSWTLLFYLSFKRKFSREQNIHRMDFWELLKFFVTVVMVYGINDSKRVSKEIQRDGNLLFL